MPWSRLPMPITQFAVKLLALAETLHRWLAVLSGLDRANRDRLADYADQIAATLARAAAASARLEAAPTDPQARADAVRELGRVAGYVETMVDVLRPHLDGRKIAGLKRRLLTLGARRVVVDLASGRADTRSADTGRSGDSPSRRTSRLRSAEGYFRAFADGLRA